MARKIQISIEEIQRAKQLRDQATTVAEYRKALSVILPAEFSIDADLTAELLGTSRRTVFRDRDRIRSQDDTPKNLWGGRRHCAMTIEEEREFLAQWIDKATIGVWVVTSPCQRLIGYWRVTNGERCNRTQSIQRVILHCRRNLKKILRSGGSRLPEERRSASAAVDVSG
jgi:hypothetical protein